MKKKTLLFSLITLCLLGCNTTNDISSSSSDINSVKISINIITPNLSSKENSSNEVSSSNKETSENNTSISVSNPVSSESISSSEKASSSSDEKPSTSSSSSSNVSLDSTVNDYYKSIDFSKSGDALKTDLYNLIKKCNMPYTYDNCDSYIANANEDPNNPNNLIEFYTGRSVPKDYYNPNESKPDAWNKEHVYAKSRGGFKSQDAGKDIHHLMPTDNGVNNKRSSKDFDECTSESNAVKTYNSYKQSVTVQYADPNDICYTTSTVFEPRDAVKGDVARILFYMATRYEGKSDGGPDLEIVDYISDTSSPIIGKLSTLKKWHEEDPVDEFEMNRNDYIYSVQNNRNPYIDHPEIVNLIF